MDSAEAGAGKKPVAYATLLTNDGYVDAALTLAKSLNNTKTPHPLICLYTPSNVSQASLTRLSSLFTHLRPVDPITHTNSHSSNTANLTLIGRPDLHTTLTKLHLWSLTEYSRVLYLDADTLVVSQKEGGVDGVFTEVPEEEDFAGAPELGYPDCFNAGMMLLRPSLSTYEELLAFAKEHESFDGGDQGVLNEFWGDGTRGASSLKGAGISNNNDAFDGGAVLGKKKRNWYRLSFTYNMEMHKVFRLYIPAVMRYREEHKILHFIGKDKPWHFEDGKVDETGGEDSPYFRFYKEMVGRWWQVRKSVEV